MSSLSVIANDIGLKVFWNFSMCVNLNLNCRQNLTLYYLTNEMNVNKKNRLACYK